MTIPPVKKNQIFAAGRETGQGVDKTDSRAHVMGVVYMADERKPEVKKSRDQNRTKRSKKTCGISWKQTAHTANF